MRDSTTAQPKTLAAGAVEPNMMAAAAKVATASAVRPSTQTTTASPVVSEH
jgi:hypothetical protein